MLKLFSAWDYHEIWKGFSLQYSTNLGGWFFEITLIDTTDEGFTFFSLKKKLILQLILIFFGRNMKIHWSDILSMRSKGKCNNIFLWMVHWWYWGALSDDTSWALWGQDLSATANLAISGEHKGKVSTRLHWNIETSQRWWDLLGEYHCIWCVLTYGSVT